MKDLLSNLNKIEKETIKRYDEIAEEYNKDWRGKHDKTQLKYLKKFEELIGPSPKRILDVGCGTGKDCIYFASRGYQIYGVDLSQGMLERAIENSRLMNLKVNLFIGDMRSLTFPSNYFDGVWNAAAIVHLSPKEKQKAIQEFYRVLKHGGILHIWVQNLLSPKHLMRLVQSYLFDLKQESNKLILRRKSLSEIKQGKSLRERVKLGYAYLDRRHWFYPTKWSLLQSLKKAKFSILEVNSIFSRRLSVYARKSN
jgi:ubiquinone/menaquinone biosynthesis C-methylase UbiE